ncbi:MAG: hypothetical protein Q8M16_12255 [Pirellulaceae bacterium]|nr:hypothetical protein [Pirellulaceae bacterium]
MDLKTTFWRAALLMGVSFFSITVTGIGLGLVFSEQFGHTRGPAVSSIGGGLGTALVGFLLFLAGRNGFVLEPRRHLAPVAILTFILNLMIFVLLGWNYLDLYLGAVFAAFVSVANTTTMALAMTAVLSTQVPFAKVRCFGTLGFAAAFVTISLLDVWSAVFVGLIGLTTLAFSVVPESTICRTSFEPTAKQVHLWPIFVAIVAYGLLSASARTYEIYGPLRLVGSSSGVAAVLILATLEILALLCIKVLDLTWILAATTAWIAAYVCYVFWGGFGEILAMVFISVNCLGQSSLIQFAARQSHAPGNVQLWYQLTGTAVGIAIACISSQLDSLASVWFFGLSVSAIVAPGLWVCAWLLRKSGDLMRGTK